MAQARSNRRFGERVSRMREVPGGTLVELPGRGRTYLVDIPGPPDAPTLMLLHGVVTTAMLNWFPALEELSRRYRVVLYDQRWHGHGIRSERFVLDDLADDAVAVADLLGIDKPVLVGYSMGGIVGQLAAHRHPGRIGGLVLCATTYRFQEKWRERAFHRTMSVFATTAAELAARRVARAAARLPDLPQVSWNPGRIDRWALGELRTANGWAMAQAVAALGKFDSEPWLESLKLPVSVVITTHDRALPVHRQLEMAKLIDGAEIFLARAGHAACVLEADAFVPVLLEACAAVTARL
ncbi:alpha/beta fold hydrolase [Nocardia pseudobrasiliensis]|uniref:Pimeloyl-ACP methyl ester carboxylesterase n=1 Tax=Nocardia pseudobrasiliensis TaxID=45979 RepID=A0A370IAP2_9NOCA|nr:alpha/beta hydrolase [Nocardia pseudobrasiliensis]RDI67758.1 pimeloyl-ACP methyl ester carboxylesterase [Nocardia pseudobrasiliensis]